MSRSIELEKKATEFTKLFKEIEDLAREHDYGVDISTFAGTLTFDDWLSSSCYGEGGEGFGTNEDGSIWYESGC